jgi:predicted O-linked N-acetylglucosamine transferase (SPINDLY family)
LIPSFHQFIDVRGLTDRQVAELSRKLEIDIAIDLGGFTQDSRTGIFAYRAAPIQAGYVGYLGTMGATYMDYLFADPKIIDSGLEQFYSEKIIYLPSYQVNDTKRYISDRAINKSKFNIPDKKFVYCCFNNNYKITPTVFGLWMSILESTEDSILFLYAANDLCHKNLRNEAHSRGINTERVIFGSTLPREEYLARYQACDLFLDTFPYNAGTTASDALWADLPVLTLMGQSFASRVGSSLLSAIDLPELITKTPKEYVAKAVHLAQNPEKLRSIKEKLQKNKKTTRLFNTPLFARDIEKAYTQMYELYHAGVKFEK